MFDEKDESIDMPRIRGLAQTLVQKWLQTVARGHPKEKTEKTSSMVPPNIEILTHVILTRKEATNLEFLRRLFEELQSGINHPDLSAVERQRLLHLYETAKKAIEKRLHKEGILPKTEKIKIRAINRDSAVDFDADPEPSR